MFEALCANPNTLYFLFKQCSTVNNIVGTLRLLAEDLSVLPSAAQVQYFENNLTMQ